MSGQSGKGLADAIGKLQATERLVLDPAGRLGFDFAAFEQARVAFEKAQNLIKPVRRACYPLAGA